MGRLSKTIFITGSTKGIGLEIAKKFNKENFFVITNSRNKKNKHEKFKYIQGDLTKISQVKNICKQLRKFNKLDVLVCNVGFSQYKYEEFPTLKEINHSLNNNFYSCFLILNELKKFLIKSKTKIICISSIAGLEILKKAPISYSISKSLLNNYLKHLSKSFARHGVTINTISPGNILFDGSTWDKKIKKNKINTLKYVKENVPLNKFGSPKDIANAVFFLSSEENNFITGSNLLIDGGQTN
jgi:3-oxoacyl-[acyl-carrier protein] reductase